MVKFGEREIAQERFHAAKRPIAVSDVTVDIIVLISQD